MTERRPPLVPPRAGAFFCPEKRKKAVTAGFKNFSKTVQNPFTHKRARCGILIMSKGSTPFFRTAAKFVFSFSFPPFSNKECAPQITVSPTAAERFLISETNLSKTVQKLFTHKRRRCGILTLSAREAAILRLTTYRSFLFLFFTPFFQICILNGQAPFSLPPA